MLAPLVLYLKEGQSDAAPANVVEQWLQVPARYLSGPHHFFVVYICPVVDPLLKDAMCGRVEHYDEVFSGRIL